MVAVGKKGNGSMKKQTAADIKISGTFNAKRFYETLAMIISNKENLSITVTVHETGKNGKGQLFK